MLNQPLALRLRRGTVVISLLAAVLLSYAGCTGGAPGSELSARPEPTPFAGGSEQVLSLPKDRAFSITLAPAEKAAGLDGVAEVDSQATEDGSARAFARVENGGKASAAFQLGHVFSNDGDRQVDLDVHVKLAFSFEAEATPELSAPDAKLALNVFARDGRNRLVRSLNVLQHTTEEGAAAGRDDTDRRIMVTLGPHDRVSVFLAGNVNIDTKPGRTASGRIDVEKLEMEVVSRPAPAVRTAADVRP